MDAAISPVAGFDQGNNAQDVRSKTRKVRMLSRLTSHV